MTFPFPDPKPNDPGASKTASRWTRWAEYLWPPAVRTLRSPERGRTASQFALELFVVLGLSVCYYFLVRNFALGVGNDYINDWVFTACGKSAFHLDVIWSACQGRLAGMLLSGSMLDWVVEGGRASSPTIPITTWPVNTSATS